MHALEIAHSPKLPCLAAVLSPSPAWGSPAVTTMAATRKCRSAPIPRCPSCSSICCRRYGSQRPSDGARTKLPPWRRDCRSTHWRQALSIRDPSTSFPMETCWWSRAMARKRRSTGPRTSSPAGYSRFAGAKAKDENRITLLRDIKGDGIPNCEPFFWTTSIRRLASRWLVTIFMSRTPMRIVRYPYQEGQTSITAAGHQAHRSSWRADRSSLDQGSVGQPGRLQALCRGRLKQQHHRKRNWRRIRTRRDLGGRPGIRRPSHLRQRNSQSNRPGVGA